MQGGQPVTQPASATISQSPSLTSPGDMEPLVAGAHKSGPISSPSQPWYTRRSNVALLACMGSVLVVLIICAAVLGTRKRDLGQPTSNSLPPIPATNTPPPATGTVYVAPTPTTDYRGRPRRVTSQRGVVAADQSVCSEIGADVLKSGGNAVDAAVATCLCQGVVNPFASGIGGGFFAVIRHPNGTSEMIDARETAPAAADWDMYQGMPPNASFIGGLSIAVPLELKGLELMWKRWGRLPWSRLVAPSATLAASGFPAFPYMVYTLNNTLPLMVKYPATAASFLIPDPGGPTGWRVPRVGEQCCQRPALAATLQAVAEQGAGWLYSQERAQSMASEIQAAGGVITAQDIMTAQPLVTPTVTMQVGPYELTLPPPPSSAAVMGLALRILLGYPTLNKTVLGNVPSVWQGQGSATPDQLLFEHRLVESLKEAFALRLALGDPGPQFLGNAPFANITDVFKDIVDPTFAALLRSDLRDDGILNKTLYGRQWNPYHNHTGGAVGDDHGTSHLSVVDASGLAVSLTTTVNWAFGSFITSPSTGVLFNNEMDDFSRPDLPNAFGLEPSEANYIGPSKRPLSSMSPTIVTEGGQLRMVVGASNGPRIISATLQTIVRILVLGWDPLDAVSVARLHHQLLPYSVRVENYTMPGYAGSLDFRVSNQLQRYLLNLGNEIAGENGQLGNSQVIYFPPGSSEAVAASDPRKDGAPAAA